MNRMKQENHSYGCGSNEKPTSPAVGSDRPRVSPVTAHPPGDALSAIRIYRHWVRNRFAIKTVVLREWPASHPWSV